ncbi:MAG: alpha/beta fold hydrolase [Sideroxydans sp.]|nr:alpha/beta fold hydrolase [Sideroxydans sp.]
MSLHIESIGSGAPLVLLHGWGMHGGVWSDVAQKLATDFQVHSVDLPGYGFSGKGEGEGEREKGGEPVLPFPLPSSPFSLETVVDELSANFPEPIAICGWSLGGQVALHWAAREPEKVRRLILVSSTPCFAARDDWQHGMAREVLEKFANELELNHAATLRRFISLQLRGSENERELLALLREKLFSRGEPDMATLRAGLDILRDADQRGELPGIKQPTLVIAGERDKLTPPQASHYMAQAMPDARLAEVKGAAHAPFLSHPEQFVKVVTDFLKAKND